MTANIGEHNLIQGEEKKGNDCYKEEGQCLEHRISPKQVNLIITKYDLSAAPSKGLKYNGILDIASRRDLAYDTSYHRPMT